MHKFIDVFVNGKCQEVVKPVTALVCCQLRHNFQGHFLQPPSQRSNMVCLHSLKNIFVALPVE